MSSNKRKRSGDDGQGPDDIPKKQKRRRSNGRKATADLDVRLSANKSQEELNNNDRAPKADTTNLVPAVQAVNGRPHGKKRSRHGDSRLALGDNEATTSIQAEEIVENDVAMANGEGARATPEEPEVQAVKSRRRRRRKSKKEPNPALEVNETSTSIQAEAKMSEGVSIPDDGVVKVTPKEQQTKGQMRNAKEKLKKLRRRSRKEQNKGLIKSTSDSHLQNKSSARKKSRGETAPTWTVSEATGGCMLRIDPLFSLNEE